MHIETEADRGRQEDTQADEKLLACTRLRISGKHSAYAGMDRSDAGHCRASKVPRVAAMRHSSR
jgi:hypothetical protein